MKNHSKLIASAIFSWWFALVLHVAAKNRRRDKGVCHAFLINVIRKKADFLKPVHKLVVAWVAICIAFVSYGA